MRVCGEREVYGEGVSLGENIDGRVADLVREGVGVEVVSEEGEFVCKDAGLFNSGGEKFDLNSKSKVDNGGSEERGSEAVLGAGEGGAEGGVGLGKAAGVERIRGCRPAGECSRVPFEWGLESEAGEEKLGAGEIDAIGFRIGIGGKSGDGSPVPELCPVLEKPGESEVFFERGKKLLLDLVVPGPKIPSSDSHWRLPVEQAGIDGGKNPAGRNLRECMTLFVNNIPPFVVVSRLKAWFSHFGSVADVFIPNKRSKVKDYRFAFVRFFHEYEALRACERADGSIFDGYVLEVNISRYPRYSFKPYSVVSGEPDLNSAVMNTKLNSAARGVSGFFSHNAGLAGVVGMNTGGSCAIPAAPLGGESGASYAQILLSGRATTGISLRSSVSGFGAQLEGGVPAPIKESVDHLQATFVCRSALGDREDRIHLSCVNELFLSEWSGGSGVAGVSTDEEIPAHSESGPRMLCPYCSKSYVAEIGGNQIGLESVPLLNGFRVEEDKGQGADGIVVGYALKKDKEAISELPKVSENISGKEEGEGQEVSTGVKMSNLDMFNALMDKANGEVGGSVTSQVVAKKKFVLSQEFINSSIRKIRDVLDECRVLGISISARDQRAILKSMTKKHIQDEIAFHAEMK